MQFTFKKSLGKQENKTRVDFQLSAFGRDWVLKITGGESHLGALGWTDKKSKKTFYNVLKGHREILIVKQTMEKIQDLIPGELLIISGIHYDNITQEQIETITINCQLLRDQLMVALINWKF